MVSPSPSYDDELLNSAYANVSLIADEAWTFNREDSFRKLNHSLWIQSCEVSVKYKGNGDHRPRFVRDVISESRLAKYGNYQYDERRERMYRPDDGKSSGGFWHFRPTEATESWMLPEVQEHFARLIAPSCTRAHREPTLSILKCNSARKENEVVCSNFQSDWNERSKKRRQKISPKKSRRDGLLHGEPIFKPNEDGISAEPREKSTGTFAHRRYTAETAAEMQLRSRIESEAVRDIWNPDRSHQKRHQQRYHLQESRITRSTPTAQPAVQHQRQCYRALQYPPLILKTEHQRRQPILQPLQPLPPPVLSAEVPEFFPKSSPPLLITYPNSDNERGNKAARQIRYFPSTNDRGYQRELFPANRPQENAAVFSNARISVLPATEASAFRSANTASFSHEWIQRIAPPIQIQLASSATPPQPICASLQPIHDVAIAHCPLQMYERFLPCTQPSPAAAIPVYQRPTELYQESTPKRKSHGVDFNNLILLTKNSIKMRRGHSKSPRQPFSSDPKQTPKSSGQNARTQQCDKDHARRTKEVVIVNALVSELRKYEYGGAAGTSCRNAEPSPRQRSTEKARVRSGVFAGENSRCRNLEGVERDTKRPLYRDVLANASSGHEMENVFQKRYDELEQQAMEQYRNSEESLALRYQELERQAMEQYRDANATDGKHNDPTLSEEPELCSDRQRCSGYKQCGSSNGTREAKDSCFPQPRITLLRPKGKSLPNVCHGSSCNDRTPQTTVASRSLSTLTDKSSKKSKNISRGASGDKIDTNGEEVRTSSKRHLILVSPFEHKSEARLITTTNMREIRTLSQARKNVLDYYRSSEIAPNGSGDENITIIKSPSTEVWLSGFWTT